MPSTDRRAGGSGGWHGGQQRADLLGLRRAVRRAVHTATAGPCPVRCHSSIRVEVHTTASGRRAGGISTRHAGFIRSAPAAARHFNAAKSPSVTVRPSTSITSGEAWNLPFEFPGAGELRAAPPVGAALVL